MRARQLLLLLSISSCSTNLFWSAANDGRASSPRDGLERIYLGGESTPGYYAARGDSMIGRTDGQGRGESWLDAVVRVQTRRRLLRQRRQGAPKVYVSGAGLEEAVMGERATIVVEVQGWSKVRYRNLALLCNCRLVGLLPAAAREFERISNTFAGASKNPHFTNGLVDGQLPSRPCATQETRLA
jgi:hypothetical protein